MMASALGWLATALSTISYFTKQSATLRKVQATAACVWMIYGIAIGAVPVIAANIIVGFAALYSLLRRVEAQPGREPLA